MSGLGWGRSPRVRGRLRDQRQWCQLCRPIPACAGETGWPTRVSFAETADPRVCGGDRGSISRGSIEKGRSPRVRGRPLSDVQTIRVKRPIPACAGETRPADTHGGPAWADPRVCGGDDGSWSPTKWGLGRSPRVRGETSHVPVWVYCHAADPRVCGGDLEDQARRHDRGGRSPRVRGRHSRTIPQELSSGPIPACAGETGPRVRATCA